MSEIMTAAGVVFDYAINGVSTVGETIVNTPVILIPFVCGIAFMAVTLLVRMVRVNA